MTAGSTKPPSSAWLPWLSSGSWQIGGIINSDMLGGCRCERLFFPVLSMHKRRGYISSSIHPSPSSKNGSCSCGETHGAFAKNKKTNRLKDFVCGGAPLASTLCCSVILLLNNSRLSHWSYDAGDGSAVLILSLQELWRCGAVVVIGATRAQRNPSWDKMKGREESTWTSV